MKKTFIAALITGVLSVSICAGTVSASGHLTDSHIHIANYAMQGVPLKTFIDDYMGEKVIRAAVFALPLQQKWDWFEDYAGGRMPPNYYLGPKAGMYYYSFVDAMLAMDYIALPEEDRERLDPMIVGFNPMDRYGVDHIRRALLLFPGVFSGIGEFSVHKELVGDKISDDLISANLPAGRDLPPDGTERSRNSLYNPSLKAIFDFAAETGLIVNLHSDVYPALAAYDGRVLKLEPENPYAPGMIHLCEASPEATVIWAHTGMGRFVKPAPDHLEIVSEILDSCPNWNADLSWDLVQAYIVDPEPGMPSLDEWAAFVEKYQERLLWGSDAVMFTKNRIDETGAVIMGREMPPEDYHAIMDILTPLWERISPDASRKIRISNHVRLFDAARTKVRSWEAIHATGSHWNLEKH